MEESPHHLLLELLLPAGRADRVLALGSGCPARLSPPPAGEEGPASAELVVLAPTHEESRDRDWLARGVEVCGAALAADGLVYVMAPPGSRRTVRDLLRDRGIGIEAAYLHLPDWHESRYLVPLEPRAARHAFTSVVPLVAWKRATAGTVLLAGGAAALVARHPSAALVGRRLGGRPLFEWLHDLRDERAPRGRAGVVLESSWRPSGPRVTLHPFAARGGRPVVAKVALDAPDEDEHTGEGSRLHRLADDARRAGAAVPVPLRTGHLHDSPVLLEDRIRGRVLAPMLARRPARLQAAFGVVCAWLRDWQHLTAEEARVSDEQLGRELLSHAALLAPALSGGEEYLAALTERCSRAEGKVIPLVSSHNDLTMWNVLIDRNDRIGIVDWEAAEEATLPLKDFFYAVGDAVAAIDRYADRPGAVRECFRPGGAHSLWVDRLQADVTRAVGATPEAVELGFQACWLGHAANEMRSVGPSDPTPFRDIVQWLAHREAAARTSRV